MPCYWPLRHDRHSHGSSSKQRTWVHGWHGHRDFSCSQSFRISEHTKHLCEWFCRAIFPTILRLHSHFRLAKTSNEATLNNRESTVTGPFVVPVCAGRSVRCPSKSCVGRQEHEPAPADQGHQTTRPPLHREPQVLSAGGSSYVKVSHLLSI